MPEPRPARRQARDLWSWLVTLSVLSASAALVSLFVTGESLQMGDQSLDRLIDACRSVWSELDARTALVLLVTGVGACAVGRTILAAWAEARRARGLAALTARAVQTRVDGTEVWVLAVDRPLAFIAGLRRPRIYLSSATIDMLGPAERAAVAAHEAHHRDRHDPLRAAAARVAVRGLFFVPGLAKLASRHAEAVELAADEAAAAVAGIQAVARALLVVSTLDHGGAGTDAGAIGLPSSGVAVAPERVDRLAGRSLPGVPAGVVVLGIVSTIGISVLGLEAVEASRAAPVYVALAAAQMCSAVAVSLAVPALSETLRRTAAYAVRSSRR